ncbi:unnamed protein product [Protopolystoma xenopodis]|uniref:Uncharacterized protein n=1 Tax=Protopolystoma xenopodis TaxID=117903 RepID=A0A3S5AJE2_9PLAT|nr:unnamed protein product [Protopolystoma xenopodis]
MEPLTNDVGETKSDAANHKECSRRRRTKPKVGSSRIACGAGAGRPTNELATKKSPRLGDNLTTVDGLLGAIKAVTRRSVAAEGVGQIWAMM